MQIHELNRSRRTDEGVLGAIGTALGQAMPGTGTTQASSAGILDPVKKLAAVKANSQMVKLATTYADEWVQQQGAAVQEDAEVAEPPVKKTTNFGAQSGYSNINTKTAPSTTTAAPVAQPTATNTTGSIVRKADPNNPNIKDQTKYVQGRAGSGANAGQFAKYDPATSAMANAGQGINNMVRGGVAAQQPNTTTQEPTAPAKTANFAGPSGYGKTTTTVKAPPAQQPAPAAKTPNFAQQGGYAKVNQPTSVKYNMSGVKPAQQQQPAQQQAPANPQYVTDFLKWANQKVAMRDKATYRTLGLVDAEKSDLKTELDAAKKAVIGAQGNPAKTKEAVKNYILTALAALQLESSKSAVKAASPEAPAYGEVGDQAAAPGQTAGAGATTVGAGVTPDQITGLLTSAGLNPQASIALGSKLQGLSQNNRVNSTGDKGVDGMLKALGYTVS
jgi:hypothetical protein